MKNASDKEKKTSNKTKTASAKTKKTNSKTKNASSKAKSTSKKTSVSSKTKNTSNKTKSVSTKAKVVNAKTKPISNKTKNASTKTIVVSTKAKPISVKTESASIKKQAISDDSKEYYLFQMDSIFLNAFSFILLALLIFLYVLIYQDKSIIIFQNNYRLLILFLVPYLILHEIVHSLSYVIHGAKFKNVTYGMHLEKGILCCLCKQNINKKNILYSLLAPFFFIGIFTLIIGIVFNIPIVVLLSLVNISGCSGDLVMFYHLVKLKDFEFSEYDDPTSFGLYSKKDLSKLKMLGLNYLGKRKELEKKDFRKVVVSKTSLIILLIFYFLMVFNLIAE